jgi:hypothetical protein
MLRQCQSTEYEYTGPTATSNRICNETEVCTTLEFEREPPTATSDRVCQPLTLCDLDVEYISQMATNTSDRVCATLTQCEAYETTAVNSTTFDDRVCTCFQSTDANLTAIITLEELAPAILSATTEAQDRFVNNVVEAVLQAARRLIDTLPLLPPDTAMQATTPEEAAGFYGLTRCSVEVVDVGETVTSAGRGGASGGLSRRAIEPLGRSSFVNITWSVPTSLTTELACLFLEVGSSRQAVFNLARLEPLYVQLNTAVAISPVLRQADGTCACGCLSAPEGKADDVSVIVYVLPAIAAALLLVLLLLMLAIRRRRQSAYTKPPVLLPPYLAPPAFVSRLMPEHERITRDPWGANQAPPYRPPPSYPGPPQDREAAALSQVTGVNRSVGAASRLDGPHVPPYREPPTYGDALLTITRQGFPESRKAPGRMQPRRRYSGLDDLFADSDLPFHTDLADEEEDGYYHAGLMTAGFPSEYGDEEYDLIGARHLDDLDHENLVDLDAMEARDGPRVLSNPHYAGGSDSRSAFRDERSDAHRAPRGRGAPDADDYRRGPRQLPDYAEPPASGYADGTLSPPAYEEPPVFPLG